MKRLQEDRLNQWIQQDKPKPLVLRGARQVGKSTLVRQFAASQGLRLYEVNLEFHPEMEAIFLKKNLQQILLGVEAICNQAWDDHRSLLFFDEIQATPAGLAALRLFAENPGHHIPVIAAGSLLEMHLESFPHSMPVGRIEYLHMGPMSFLELLEALGHTMLKAQLESYRLGQEFNPLVHKKLIEHLREYLIVGGMPEAVESYRVKKSLAQVQATQQFILDTYQDDFFKYRDKVDARSLRLLRQLFQYVPRHIGQKIKFSRISADDKALYVREAIDLLHAARVIHKVVHTHGTGLPLAAEAQPQVFKCIFLDVGLVSRLCGMDWASLETWNEIRLVNEGGLAEQYVTQELLFESSGVYPPAAFYWQREEKSSSAEIDLLISIGPRIIPVEIKAGAAGTMKSLQRIVYERSLPIALRFDLNPPSEQTVSVLVEGKTVRYQLISLPLYMAGRARSLLTPRMGELEA